MKFERLIGPEHLSGGDAKQKRVADVPSGASYGDFNRSFHGAISQTCRGGQAIPPALGRAEAWQALFERMTGTESANRFRA